MLELTDAAITEAVSKTQNDGRDTIRIGVTGGGGTGFKYVFRFAGDVHSSSSNSSSIGYGRSFFTALSFNL